MKSMSDKMLDKMKTIEALAQQINECYKDWPADLFDCDDYETVNVIRAQCDTISNAANWTQGQITMFHNDQTDKIFEHIFKQRTHC